MCEQDRPNIGRLTPFFDLLPTQNISRASKLDALHPENPSNFAFPSYLTCPFFSRAPVGFFFLTPQFLLPPPALILPALMLLPAALLLMPPLVILLPPILFLALPSVGFVHFPR